MTKSALSPINIQTDAIKFNKKDLTGVMVNRLEINLESKLDELSESKNKIQKEISETQKTFTNSLKTFANAQHEKDLTKLKSILSKIFVEQKEKIMAYSTKDSVVISKSLFVEDSKYYIKTLFNLRCLELKSVETTFEVTDKDIISDFLKCEELRTELGGVFSEQADAKKKLRDLPKLERRLNAQITEQALKDTDGGEELIKQMESTVSGTGFSNFLSLNS